MNRRHAIHIVWPIVGLLTVVTGCLSGKPDWQFVKKHEVPHYEAVATDIEYPTVNTSDLNEVDTGESPHSIRQVEKTEYWDMTLQEAVQMALRHSKVLQNLGGTILRSPETISTTYDPSIIETDPQFGVESALSAFDAQFASSLFFEKGDRRVNNQFIGVLGDFTQDYDNFQASITKRGATGDQYTIRKVVDFDYNNNIGNEFKMGAWDVYLEGEVRHPFLKGNGLEYNRIAGPNARAGVYSGVLLARVRTDVSLAEFEMGVRELVANVENSYWDLYFAYRDLDTKVQSRDVALETWRRINALYQAGRRGGEAEKEAQAREQYYRFEEEVQTALSGRIVEWTRTNNGTQAGSFRGNPGVYVNERRLRMIVGLPLNDKRLIRPAEEPSASPITFDWVSVGGEALLRRPELRRQRWIVKSRELSLLASKNFLLPSLDMVGRYRWRGFGSELIGPDKVPFDSAMANFYTGHYQEWLLGAEFSMPFGFREGHSAVRNAEILLTRSQAVLREQEQQIVHDLSNAVAEVDRAYSVLQTNVNRCVAAKEQLASVQAAYEEDRVEFFVVLDAQRRYLDAVARYYQARVEYALAVRNIYFEKGTLLEDYGVFLNEGPWPEKAYFDAGDRERLRGKPREINYSARTPIIVGTR